MACKDAMVKMLDSTGLYSLQEDSIVAAEIAAYSAGLALIEQDMETLYHELFLQTAQSFGLDIWGSNDGFTEGEISVELRRQLLLKRMAVTLNDFTPEGIRRSLEAVGVTADLADNIDRQTLLVYYSDFVLPFPGQQRIVSICEAVVPAYLNVIYEFG